MQSDAQSPKAYLDSLEEDWRKATLLSIRDMVFNSADKVSEYMEYGMLGYAVDDKPIFNLNAQKGYVSFYVGNIDKIDPDRSILAGLNCGKGCIRFSKTKGPDGIDFQAFIEKAISIAKQGGDLSC